MNTENVLQEQAPTEDAAPAPAVSIPGNEVKELLFGEQAERIDVMGKILERIEQSKLVPAGVGFDNWDKDPTKRMIVMKAFDHSKEWYSFLVETKYSFLIEHAQDFTLRVKREVVDETVEAVKAVAALGKKETPKFPTLILPLGPVFHLKFQQYLIKKGLIAPMADGLAYLQSITKGNPLGAAVGDDEPTPGRSDEELAQLGTDIEKDFGIAQHAQ